MEKVRLQKQKTLKEKYQKILRPATLFGLLFLTMYFCYLITPPTYGYLSYVLASVFL